MTDNALIATSGSALMPAMDIAQAVARHNSLVDFTKRIMVPGVDFGVVPGTVKPTLLKPGAEKLTTFFGLIPRYEIIEQVEQWDTDDPFFYYWFRCALYRGDVYVGGADGSCNSRESRYRWRWVQEHDVSPGLDKATLKRRGGKTSEFVFAIEQGKTDGKYGKPEEYWQAFKDAIANGTAKKIEKVTAKKAVYDAWEIEAYSYRMPNEDIFSQVNTVLKMAQKRALVAATLVTVNASEFFTQDMEDLEMIDVPVTVVATQPVPKPTAKPKGTSSVAREPPEYDNGTASWNEPPPDIGHQVDVAEAKRETSSLEPHWMDRVDREGLPIRPAFWKWVKSKMALSNADAYAALDVEHIHDYTGTLQEAMDQIETWAAEQADKEPIDGYHWANDPAQVDQFHAALDEHHIDIVAAMEQLGIKTLQEDTSANVTAALLEIGIKV